MTGHEYQIHAEKTNTVTGELALYYAVLGLTGEAGEIANKVKKIIRDDKMILTEEKKQTIKKELGDVMWYVARICNELEVSLDDVMAENIQNLAGRVERGSLHGSGDNR